MHRRVQDGHPRTNNVLEGWHNAFLRRIVIAYYYAIWLPSSAINKLQMKLCWSSVLMDNQFLLQNINTGK